MFAKANNASSGYQPWKLLRNTDSSFPFYKNKHSSIIFQAQSLIKVQFHVDSYYLRFRDCLKLNNIIVMASRFEYNFTRQSEFEELKDRNHELEEENTLLKQSLEELIKVNNELTESIEELNNANHYNQNHEDIEERFEMLIDQNRNLREQLQNEINSNKTKKSIIEDDNQTENLVNVLEELIDSFKNIEAKYESQIGQLEQALEAAQTEHAARLAKIEQELSGKISTIEALSTQLKRKEQIFESISAKLNKLEQQQQSRPISVNKNAKLQDSDIKKLQTKIENINKSLEEKERVIRLYENLINNLKGKIMEKY